MEEIKVEDELRLVEVKRENMRKTMEQVKSQASELLVLSLQWSDLEDNIKSAERNVEKKLREVESKETELEERSVAIEERAKVVEAAEATIGDLETKADGFRREIEEKGKEVDFLKNRVDCCNGEYKAVEMRLRQLKTSVEEYAVERRSKIGQLEELLRKTQVEFELKREELEQMKTDLERHRVEVSVENERLVFSQTRRGEMEEEIERTRKVLKLVLDKTMEREKLLETLFLELKETQDELDLNGEQLGKMKTDLERLRDELSAEIEHQDRNQTRNSELEEEIERKREDLTAVLNKIAEYEKQLELKGEQLGQMMTDLERHGNELSAEKEHLDRNQARNIELEEEIEGKRKDLTAVLNKIADYEKQLESVEAQVDSQQKLLETRSSEEKELEELKEAKRSAILDLDLLQEMVKSLNNDMKVTCQQMESKAEELEDIEKMIEERNAHYDSINELIEEHNEELVSKEKKQNEITESIRKLSFEIVSKEKTLEKQREKENKLESTKRHIEKATAEEKKKLCSVKDTLEIKEKGLKSLQSLVEEKNKEVEDGKKKMQDLDKSSEELTIQLQVKKEEVCSINNAIRDCSSALESKREERDQVQRSLTDLTAELTSKECDLNSVKKKIQDSLKDLEEQQVRLKTSLMEREQELVLKEKQFDARSEKIEQKEKELDEKDQLLKTTEERLAKCVKDCEQKATQLSSFCKQKKPKQHVDLVRDAKVKDEKTLQLLLRGHLKKCDQLHPEVLRALKASSNPGKLVLDTIRGRMAITNLDPISVRRSSICLLECLMDMSPKPKSGVKGEAIKFVTEWKNATLVDAENPVEVLEFLHFLAVFSLAYSFDADKVQKLFNVAFLGKYAPSLCEALGLSALAPVKNIISLDDKPEEQPPEAPIHNSNVSPSPSVQENEAVSQSANGNALMDSEGSASLSRDEVSSGLRAFKDPRRIVLDYVEEAIRGANQRGELGLAEPIVKTLVPFLEELAQDTKSIEPRLQVDAFRLANQWSSMMGSAQMSPLPAWGFLQLIAAYGLVDRTNQDIKYASYVAHFNQAPRLFQSLGLSHAVPSLVCQLLNQRKYIPAIRFICFFNLKTKYSPVELLKKEITNLRLSAKEKRIFDSQAEERDAGKLREIIQVIEDLNLEIDLPVDLIVKFMVPRGIQNQNQCLASSSSVPVQQVHLQSSGSNASLPNPLVIDVETYEAGGSTARSSHQAGFKRPRMDPPGPRSAVRRCFNPPSSGGYGRS